MRSATAKQPQKQLCRTARKSLEKGPRIKCHAFRETVLSTVTMPINGVGTLFFEVGDDLHPFLADKEFLHMTGACRKHRV
ncbi:hypothetical protein Y032_0386g443 [Ancylostoma ceylanicum]|uniref:Uncharacterized protein n=1 Tax=Ancylostoma ceylanicum TaxID=53326 RepID=A0A016RSQ3_9BILA|nr:hypothetical protein Y032_0386g443 [Ancylostoma ceylanicum]